MEIGERIKQRREYLGMSQEELAHKVGYKSRSSVNKIEIDGRGLPQKKIIAFAKALETTPAYLMGWESADNDYVLYSNDIPIYIENRLKKQLSLSDRVLIYAAKLAKLPVERQDIIFKMIDELSISSKGD